MREDLSKFERSVMDAALAGEHPVLEALRRQLKSSRIRERTLTGAGFFTRFEVNQSVPAAPTTQKTLRIGDVSATVKGLEHGAGFVLFVSDGYLDMLEGYSFEEPWPDRIDEFDIQYVTGGARDLSKLKLE